MPCSFVSSSYLRTNCLRRCGRMLSHLIDIPASLFFAGSVRWTLSWIILLSALYTYFVNQLSKDEETLIRRTEPDPGRTTSRQYFAQLRRLQSEQRALDEKRRRIVEGNAFRLLDLPPEVALLVLAHAADWPSTYASLVRASRRCQALTFRACLPRMPVRLISPEQVRSFDLLLRTRVQPQPLAGLVRYMWVTPLQEASLAAAVGIVKKCTQLRALASNTHVVKEAVTLRGARVSHAECKDLTLLSTRAQAWAGLLGTAHGAAFFAQLTRLRLIGDRVPVHIPLPNLTQLSYGTSGRDGDAGAENTPRIGLAMFDDREMYPALEMVIFTRPRGNAGGLRVSRPVAKTRLFVLELPATNTELEIWCDSAHRRGMWELCADPPMHSPSPKGGRHLRVK
ncbi:hypothetical protein BJ912DRAFT_963257 [Pholiota molesta]|nr:hypothetical protein BJ912DRAFT_963257 [Pholiota molesta]